MRCAVRGSRARPTTPPAPGRRTGAGRPPARTRVRWDRGAAGACARPGPAATSAKRSPAAASQQSGGCATMWKDCKRERNGKMGQAVWTGSISFGLVNIPVRLYPATQPKDVRFHLYDRRTGKRVRYERITRAEEPATFAPEPAAAPTSPESRYDPRPMPGSDPERVRKTGNSVRP